MMHYPSVELSEPDLLKLGSNLSGTIFVDHLGELGSFSVVHITASTFLLSHHENLLVKEGSEILADREIN
jgi:hypothetical protein